jgi:putative tricarboxylic transport membrane protein
MRKAELVVTVVFLLLAGVLAWEAVQLGVEWTSAGPGPGFVSLWLALAIAAAGLGLLIQAAKTVDPPRAPFFPSRAAAVFWLKVLAPMIGVVALVHPLGIYITAGLYLAFFSAWIGHRRWFVVLGVSVLIPLVMYVGFERLFKLPLPKSVLYGNGLPF